MPNATEPRALTREADLDRAAEVVLDARLPSGAEGGGEGGAYWEAPDVVRLVPPRRT